MALVGSILVALSLPKLFWLEEKPGTPDSWFFLQIGVRLLSVGLLAFVVADHFRRDLPLPDVEALNATLRGLTGEIEKLRSSFDRFNDAPPVPAAQPGGSAGGALVAFALMLVCIRRVAGLTEHKTMDPPHRYTAKLG